MAMTVNTNTFSMNAQRQLMRTEAGLQTAMQRLSSGLRINSAKDDAAGLQIANKMQVQINGMSVAMRNANDGISMAQTAEGAMEEMTTSLQRMRDLAMQASSGTLSDGDRAALNDEFTALRSEIDRIANTTSFNGNTLLDGSAGGNATITVDYSGGANNVAIDIADFNVAAFGDGLSISDTAGAAAAVTAVDLSDDHIAAAGDATTAIGEIDEALRFVDAQRAQLGATQNRLTSTVNNLANVRENLTASRSRVMDADFAKETAKLSSSQVMQQAGTAILAQANAIPQNVLSLLR